MMVNKSSKAQRTVGFCLWILLSVSLWAQEKNPNEPGKAAGNALRRIFYGNYTSPPVHGYPLGGDSWESLVQDGRLRISEGDALRLALSNNVDINVERYNPYSSLWEIEKGKSVLNPLIEFTANLDRLVTPTSSALQGGDTLLNLNMLYDFSFRKPFEPGLDLAFHFRTSRARTSNFFTSLNPYLETAIGVTFTQHLLKDFGRLSRGRHLRIAKNNHEISEEDFIVQTTDIITEVLNAYWDLVWSAGDIEVKEASLKLAQLVLEQNRIQAEVGSIAELDVIQAEAEVASRNQQLVVARYNKRILEDRLKKYIFPQMDPGTIALLLEPTSEPDPPPVPSADVAEAIQLALEVRPEVRRLMLDLENKKIDVDYTRNQLKPTLDFVASYSQHGLGGDLIERDFSQGFFNAPVVREEPGGFWNSLDSLFSRRFIGYTLGFRFQVPIGNNAARTNNAQAQITYRQSQERLRSLRQTIALEVRQAYEWMERNRASVEAAAVTVRYQDRRVQGEQDKYALGATTTRFILEAQRDLQSAHSVLLQARIDLIKSRIAVDRALGDTFAAHNIELKDALRSFK